MKYFVYILISESTSKFYIGQTQGFDQRLAKENDINNLDQLPKGKTPGMKPLHFWNCSWPGHHFYL